MRKLNLKHPCPAGETGQDLHLEPQSIEFSMRASMKNWASEEQKNKRTPKDWHLDDVFIFQIFCINQNEGVSLKQTVPKMSEVQVCPVMSQLLGFTLGKYLPFYAGKVGWCHSVQESCPLHTGLFCLKLCVESKLSAKTAMRGTQLTEFWTEIWLLNLVLLKSNWILNKVQHVVTIKKLFKYWIWQNI